MFLKRADLKYFCLQTQDIISVLRHFIYIFFEMIHTELLFQFLGVADLGKCVHVIFVFFSLLLV